MQRFLVLSTLLGTMALSLAAQSGSSSAATGPQRNHSASYAHGESNVTLPTTENILYNFGSVKDDGAAPYTGLMQASDGNFYGVTKQGGIFIDGFSTYGTLYQFTPAGQESVVYAFTGQADGCTPFNTPIEASDGNLYGATLTCGGPNLSGGTIYQYNLATATLTTVYTFLNGGYSFGNFIDDGNGTLYGTASGDGVNGKGSVWSFNYKTNTFTTLYSFTDGNDGGYPQNKLVLATDGNLYSTAVDGPNGDGVVFMLGTDGSNFQVIHAFTGGTDGSGADDLVQYSDGNLYGYNGTGGASGSGVFYQIVPNGSSSTFKTLSSFTPPTDGYGFGYGPPFIGGDGKFYAVSIRGGAYGHGQAMQLDSLGNKAAVYDFVASGYPIDARPFESTDGNLYATAYSGAQGYIYELPLGLPPVITLTPSAGVVEPGGSITLTWAVTNAFSKDAQVCIARSTDGSWPKSGSGTGSGTGTGSVALTGSATVSPRAASGLVTYALTCGGVETAIANVTVGNTALYVVTSALPNDTIGTAYSAVLTATNGAPPYTWSIASGSLPLGLSLAAGTGVISGTPTQNGIGNFVAKVTDSAGATASASLAIAITSNPLTVSRANLANGATRTAYSQAFSASGGTPPYTWSIASGSLPRGLSLDAATGVVSGTPAWEGTYQFTVQVTDAEPAYATADGAITILPGESALPAGGNTFWGFNPGNGDAGLPNASVIQLGDGNFYGVTPSGGASGAGTIYRITPSGQETLVYSWSHYNGVTSTPVQASDGNLYGTTISDGANSGGTIYQYNLKTGAFAAVYSLPAGANAIGDIIDDGNGTLYGASYGPYDTSKGSNFGSVWSFNYNTNTFTTLYSFTGASDGDGPNGLVLATDGKLYGLASAGGSGHGTAFSLNTDGSGFTVVHTFGNGTDGGYPVGALVQYSDGNLYGFTQGGGANGNGVFFQLAPNGASSILKPIYPFKSNDGSYLRYGHPLIGGDGKFYVAGGGGGATGFGEVMQLDTLGNKAAVFDFSGNSGPGYYPNSQPFEGADGNLYGTTFQGINYGGGVYQLLTYLPPAIALTSSVTEVAPGESLTLTWAVTNAFSKSAQVCIARSTDNSWTGQVSISGSASVTPTASGAVFYSLTCGGVESAVVIVNGDTPLVISTSTLPDGQIYAPYSAGPTVSGGTPPYTWSLVQGSKLPQGLSFAASTGVIYGRPTHAGNASFGVQVTDSQYRPVTTSAQISLTIDPNKLAVTTASLSSGAVGTAYSQMLGANGGILPYTWSITSGSLPAGLSFTPGTGTISGTPTQTGTSSFAVQVVDSSSPKAIATASFSIAINTAPPAITTSSLPDGTVGAAYSQKLAASGGTAPYTWSLTTGTLPSGLTLDAGTGVISGTPTFAVMSNFTVKAADSGSTPASAAANLSININPASIVPVAPTVTTSLNPASIVAGQSTTATAAVSGAKGSPIPTGTVQFQSNGSNLGSPMVLAADGTAALPNQVFSTVGSYAITANYAGDANYTAASSAAATLTVTSAPPIPPSITASPATVTITAPGGTGLTTLTFANFSANSITLACSGLPAGASCTFGAVSSSGASTALLWITTTPATANQSSLAAPHNRNRGGLPVAYALALPGLLALVGLFSVKRRLWQRMFLLLLLLSAGLAITACGGSSNKGAVTNPTPTPTGTSSVKVTATAGTQSATQSIALVVQ